MVSENKPSKNAWPIAIFLALKPYRKAKDPFFKIFNIGTRRLYVDMLLSFITLTIQTIFLVISIIH